MKNLLLILIIRLADEIKRALIHRSRIRKNYFKMLENEGEPMPGQKAGAEPGHGDKNKSANIQQQTADEHSDSDNDQGGFFEGEESFSDDDENNSESEPNESPSSTSKSISKAKTNSSTNKKTGRSLDHKSLTYQERTQLIKARKEEKRLARERYTESRRVEHDRREKKRLEHRKQMTKFTKHGQPVMGQRINRLLDKIRESQ